MAKIGHCQFLSKLSVTASIDIARPSRIRSLPQIKSMLSFTHPSTDYDGADRASRAEHDLWFLGYGSCVVGSPQARKKEVIGDLICPTVAGDDAYVTYGCCLAVVLHAAVPGDGLDLVPFLLNSPKDTALARILEEAVLGVNEDASGLSMPEWVKHCADLRKGKSLSARSKHALTLGVDDFFHRRRSAQRCSAEARRRQLRSASIFDRFRF